MGRTALLTLWAAPTIVAERIAAAWTSFWRKHSSDHTYTHAHWC